MRFSKKKFPRIEAAIAHTEEQLGVYVSADETQRLTDARRRAARAVSGAYRGVGRADGATGWADGTVLRRPSHPVVHNQKTMALLWNPESWSQRLAELEAQSGDLKEAPLRRDVRSLGMLLGEVLREQAGDELFAASGSAAPGHDPAPRRRGTRPQRRSSTATPPVRWRLVHKLPVGTRDPAHPRLCLLLRAHQSG